MPARDEVHEGEPQADALAHSARGEERIEDLVAQGGGDAGAVVREAQLHLSLAQRAADPQHAPRAGLGGVAQQVRDGGRQRARVAVHRGQPSEPLQAHVQGQPLVQRALDHLLEQRRDLEVAPRSRRHQTERAAQLAHDVAGAPRLLEHLLALLGHHDRCRPRAAADLFELVLEVADRGRDQRGERGQPARALRFFGMQPCLVPGAAVHFHLPAQAHGGGDREQGGAGRRHHARGRQGDGESFREEEVEHHRARARGQQRRERVGAGGPASPGRGHQDAEGQEPRHVRPGAGRHRLAPEPVRHRAERAVAQGEERERPVGASPRRMVDRAPEHGGPDRDHRAQRPQQDLLGRGGLLHGEGREHDQSHEDVAGRHHDEDGVGQDRGILAQHPGMGAQAERGHHRHQEPHKQHVEQLSRPEPGRDPEQLESGPHALRDGPHHGAGGEQPPERRAPARPRPFAAPPEDHGRRRGGKQQEGISHPGRGLDVPQREVQDGEGQPGQDQAARPAAGQRDRRGDPSAVEPARHGGPGRRGLGRAPELLQALDGLRCAARGGEERFERFARLRLAERQLRPSAHRHQRVVHLVGHAGGEVDVVRRALGGRRRRRFRRLRHRRRRPPHAQRGQSEEHARGRQRDLRALRGQRGVSAEEPGHEVDGHRQHDRRRHHPAPPQRGLRVLAAGHPRRSAVRARGGGDRDQGEDPVDVGGGIGVVPARRVPPVRQHARNGRRAQPHGEDPVHRGEGRGLDRHRQCHEARRQDDLLEREDPEPGVPRLAQRHGDEVEDEEVRGHGRHHPFDGGRAEPARAQGTMGRDQDGEGHEHGERIVTGVPEAEQRGALREGHRVHEERRLGDQLRRGRRGEQAPEGALGAEAPPRRLRGGEDRRQRGQHQVEMAQQHARLG